MDMANHADSVQGLLTVLLSANRTHARSLLRNPVLANVTINMQRYRKQRECMAPARPALRRVRKTQAETKRCGPALSPTVVLCPQRKTVLYYRPQHGFGDKTALCSLPRLVKKEDNTVRRRSSVLCARQYRTNAQAGPRDDRRERRPPLPAWKSDRSNARRPFGTQRGSLPPAATTTIWPGEAEIGKVERNTRVGEDTWEICGWDHHIDSRQDSAASLIL